MNAPTEKAREFMTANEASPVVSGYAIEPDPRKPGKGGCYTLKDGRMFRLSLEDCRSMPAPRWDI